MQMHVFFFIPLMWGMPKRELSIDLKHFTQSDISTIFFSKWKGRLNETFQFRIENAFNTSNNNKSDQIQIKKFNRLPRERRLNATSLFNTKMIVMTLLSIKNDSSIRLLLIKDDCKWWKIHKKKITNPDQWRLNNVKEGGFSNDILIISSKTTK